jgi:hypothetical protein
VLIVGLAVLALWLTVIAIVAGLCISAAQGDRAQRRLVARQAARAHRRHSLRLTA